MNTFRRYFTCEEMTDIYKGHKITIALMKSGSTLWHLIKTVKRNYMTLVGVNCGSVNR